MIDRSKSRENGKVRLVAITLMILRGRKITTAEILRELDLRYDIQAGRKAIYSDIAAIDRLIPIEVIAGRSGGYRRMKFD